MKLTLNQRKVIADIASNLAIAWISIGTISQIVFKMEDKLMAVFSVILFLIFASFAIVSVK